MSKNQTKTKAMAVVNVDPRVRMKEVRTMVANAHKQGKRIDLMNFTGDDIARSQIAIQDLLSNEQKRHAKARGHIVDQKKIITTLVEMSMFISNVSTEQLLRDQDRMANMAQELRETSAQNGLLHQQQNTLLDEKAQLSVDLEAAVNTVRIVLNGNTNG